MSEPTRAFEIIFIELLLPETSGSVLPKPPLTHPERGIQITFIEGKCLPVPYRVSLRDDANGNFCALKN
jgi:hypothetical protein